MSLTDRFTQIHVAPHNYTQYAFRIPESHPQGLFWYHAHPHGTTSTQLHGGLAGLLIVEYEENRFPELQNVTERLFMIKDFVPEDEEEDNICGMICGSHRISFALIGSHRNIVCKCSAEQYDRDSAWRTAAVANGGNGAELLL